MSFKNIGRAAACLVFAVAPGLALASSVVALTTCDEPVEFDGRHYEVVTGIGQSWDWAKDQAESRTHLQVYGQLATITSAAEDVFVESLRQCAKAKGVLGAKNAAWVGGEQVAPFPNDPPKAGDGWQWVNGEGPISTRDSTFTPVTYSNWLPNEPNDLNGESHLTVGHTGAFGWNDEGNLGNIGGYIVEYNTASSVDAEDCLEVNGCETTAGQNLQLPPIVLDGELVDASLGVRTYEFTDNPARCGMSGLTLFDGKLIIPPYLCGSPKFLVVEVERKNFEIQQGTVFIENEPLVALPDNWYECDGQTFGDGAPLLPGDPQARDVVAWQATDFKDMLEYELSVNRPGVESQFAGALGEFTFECGSSRGLTRNLSYLVIGMHINFGVDNADSVNERFVALTGYKLQLLQESVADSQGALSNGDFTSLRSLVRNAIRYHGRGDFDEALEKIEVFLKQVDATTYAADADADGDGVNFNGEHLARGKNIKFMYEEKVIPFAP